MTVRLAPLLLLPAAVLTCLQLLDDSNSQHLRYHGLVYHHHHETLPAGAATAEQ